MSEKKLKIIRSSADEYKKLPKDKQMFVLGFMQGVLSNQQEKSKEMELHIERVRNHRNEKLKNKSEVII